MSERKASSPEPISISLQRDAPFLVIQIPKTINSRCGLRYISRTGAIASGAILRSFWAGKCSLFCASSSVANTPALSYVPLFQLHLPRADFVLAGSDSRIGSDIAAACRRRYYAISNKRLAFAVCLASGLTIHHSVLVSSRRARSWSQAGPDWRWKEDWPAKRPVFWMSWLMRLRTAAASGEMRPAAKGKCTVHS